MVTEESILSEEVNVCPLHGVYRGFESCPDCEAKARAERQTLERLEPLPLPVRPIFDSTPTLAQISSRLVYGVKR